MARAEDGPYRVTTITQMGFPQTRKIHKWSDAYRAYDKAKLWARYAVIVELSEDEHFAKVREEYYVKN